MDCHIFRCSRLVFRNGPEAAAQQAEAPSSGVTKSELIKRADDVKRYYNVAYAGFCYDFDAAAKKFGFKDRAEADKYLSETTGSNYSETLKTGDRMISPVDGVENVYFSTAKEARGFFESKDFFQKEAVLMQIDAHIIAEASNFPLKVTSMMAIHVYAVIIRNPNLFKELKEGENVSHNNAVIEKTADGYYYNSDVRSNNLWGRLDGGEDYYVKHDGQFINVKQHIGFGYTGVNAYLDLKNRRAFDANGNYSESLTKELRNE